jgi:hypothetical protein
LFLLAAKPHPAAVGARAEIFPGLADLVQFERTWYDWAVADLLMREVDEMVTQAEQSVSRMHGRSPTLEELAIVRAAGEWHALHGEWAKSLACSQFCLQSNEHDTVDHATMDYFNAAIACLKLGEKSRYFRLRREMTARFNQTDQANRVLLIALLAPIDDRATWSLEPLAAALRRDTQKGSDANPWDYVVLALLDYRRANYSIAIDLARRSVAIVPEALPNAVASVISGLCLSQIEGSSAARSELDRAERLIQIGFNVDYDMWHWRHWVALRLLLADAQASIPQAPPSQPSPGPR